MATNTTPLVGFGTGAWFIEKADGKPSAIQLGFSENEIVTLEANTPKGHTYDVFNAITRERRHLVGWHSCEHSSRCTEDRCIFRANIA